MGFTFPSCSFLFFLAFLLQRHVNSELLTPCGRAETVSATPLDSAFGLWIVNATVTHPKALCDSLWFVTFAIQHEGGRLEAFYPPKSDLPIAITNKSYWANLEERIVRAKLEIPLELQRAGCAAASGTVSLRLECNHCTKVHADITFTNPKEYDEVTFDSPKGGGATQVLENIETSNTDVQADEASGAPFTATEKQLTQPQVKNELSSVPFAIKLVPRNTPTGLVSTTVPVQRFYAPLPLSLLSTKSELNLTVSFTFPAKDEQTISRFRAELKKNRSYTVHQLRTAPEDSSNTTWLVHAQLELSEISAINATNQKNNKTIDLGIDIACSGCNTGAAFVEVRHGNYINVFPSDSMLIESLREPPVHSASIPLRLSAASQRNGGREKRYRWRLSGTLSNSSILCDSDWLIAYSFRVPENQTTALKWSAEELVLRAVRADQWVSRSIRSEFDPKAVVHTHNQRRVVLWAPFSRNVSPQPLLCVYPTAIQLNLIVSCHRCRIGAPLMFLTRKRFIPLSRLSFDVRRPLLKMTQTNKSWVFTHASTEPDVLRATEIFLEYTLTSFKIQKTCPLSLTVVSGAASTQIKPWDVYTDYNGVAVAVFHFTPKPPSPTGTSKYTFLLSVSRAPKCNPPRNPEVALHVPLSATLDTALQVST